MPTQRLPSEKPHYYNLKTGMIHGKANVTLTSALLNSIGLIAGHQLKRGNHRHKVIIAKDTRRSGYMIEAALTAGFLSAGMDVDLIGPIPSSGLAMFTRLRRADVGVMITSSHEGFEESGIILFGPDGIRLTDEKMLEIERLINSDLSSFSAGSELGAATRIENTVQGGYVTYLQQMLQGEVDLSTAKIRVVLDCGNGAAYKVAPEALAQLGAELVLLGTDPDGFNINLQVGATAPSAAREKVKGVRANIGIALDADADGVVIIDEQGAMLSGDHVLALIAERWKAEGRLEKNTVVIDLLSSLTLEQYLKGCGIKVVRTQKSDSREVLQKMRERGCSLGGTPSGHIFMPGYSPTSDGLIAALQVLAVLVKDGKPLSELANRFVPARQEHYTIPYPVGANPRSSTTFKRTAKEADGQLQAGKLLGRPGRLVIHPPGAERVIDVTIESDDPVLQKEVREALLAAVNYTARRATSRKKK